VAILLLTHSRDNLAVSMVERAIRERGGTPLRFDTDLYPTEVRLSTRYAGRRIGGWIVTPAGRVELDAITAIWYRRFAAGRGLPETLGEHRSGCVQESRHTLFGTIAAMNVFQLDPLNAVQRCEHKEVQLQLAARCGLDVPLSLYSNDGEAVRQFTQELAGRVICKLQSNFAIGRPGEEMAVYTSRIRPEDMGDLEQLRYCPMLFQEAVPKQLELRSIVVGRRVLSAAVDSQQSERSSVDWRREAAGLSQAWQSYTLPEPVEQALLRLTAALGLNYGAADFVLTPDGRHVFLEINSGGEWGWLAQHEPHLPVAEHLAEVLLGSAERYVR
jgi:glutathione synthase/RimK-type ligase-like ATP-grasp enzyme